MPITVTITGENATEVKRNWEELTGADTKQINIQTPTIQPQTTPQAMPAQPAQAPSTTFNPQPAPPQTVPPIPPAVPTTPPAAPPMASAPIAPPATPPVASAPTYTKDQLGRAGSALVDAGKMQDVTNLLARFGVQTLGNLPESNYGEFATGLRQLGAQI